MPIFEKLISAIAPHRCLACGLEGAPFCSPCGNQLPCSPECCYKCGKAARNGLCSNCSAQSELQSIGIRTTYTGLAEQAIHQLKFEGNRQLAEELAQCMMQLCPAGIITHVPTANHRVRQRGYDQAQLMARALAKATGNPYAVLLQRLGSQRQLGQSRAVREKQLRQAFRSARQIPSITNRPVILVDDVFTTGSTFEAAAKVLKSAGYDQLHALAFAWAS